MACRGSYCAQHCYVNYCQGKYRASRTGDLYTFPALGDSPTAAFTNALKTALNQEINDRNSHQASYATATFTDAKSKTDLLAKTSTEVLLELKNKINAIHTGTNTDTFGKSTIIHSYQWDNIKNQILTLMRECLCNGDCGAHTVCACYNDCGCNY